MAYMGCTKCHFKRWLTGHSSKYDRCENCGAEMEVRHDD